MNTNWPKWIVASIYKHVTDTISGYPVHIEGQKIHSLADTDYMYLRVNGPKFRELSAGFWRIDLALNMLVQHLLDDELVYKAEEMCGEVTVAFDQAIPILKLGDKAGDDSTQIGCLKTTSDGIPIVPFGQVKPGVEITQSTVECHYTAELREE